MIAGSVVDCGAFRLRIVLRHVVLPLSGRLEATEDRWYCRTCGTVFVSPHGYARCPDDPLGALP